MQIRQAAATARKALIALAAQRLNMNPEDLIATGGEVRPKAGGAGIGFANLIGGRQFDLKLDPKAPLKDPATYTIVGKPLPRPDVALKCTGTATYVHDFTLPGMQHARVIRPPAIGATLISVDEDSVKNLPDVKVVRIKNFLAVVAEDEWTTVRAARALRAQWSEWSGLPAQDKLVEALRADPGITDESLVTKGAPVTPQPQNAKTLAASYFWPMQSHASLGPSCAVADVRADAATVWTASQGAHDNQTTFARFLGLPKDKVRLIYLEGSGCYGMNGHEDAAADAAILSQAVGRPVRVQWSRADEHGWDPKGPPQLLDIAGVVGADGRILDWRTDMWIPQTTRGLLNIPLLGPQAAGLDNIVGLNTGLISQNGDPPYAADHIQVIVHWLKETPLRPAPLRSPGKPANCFAVESFTDELAAAAGIDPIEFRLRGLENPRGIELIKRVATMMKWQSRPSPGAAKDAAVVRGRGMSYVHYKHSETFVAMGMEVAVERASGKIKVERVVCAQSFCGAYVKRLQARGSICASAMCSRTGIVSSKALEDGVRRVYFVRFPFDDVRQRHRLHAEQPLYPLECFLDGEDVGAEAGAVSAPAEADILRDDEIDGFSIEGRQEPNVRPVVIVVDRTEPGDQTGFGRKRDASKLLEFCELAERDRATRLVFVARNVVVVGPVNEQPNAVFAAEANKLSERCLNGLGVFEPNDHVRVDQELEPVHRSATQCKRQ
jgi:CO/xanthine dehydrogenase Mo-binding subunit